jgi:hypothetical protein
MCVLSQSLPLRSIEASRCRRSQSTDCHPCTTDIQKSSPLRCNPREKKSILNPTCDKCDRKIELQHAQHQHHLMLHCCLPHAWPCLPARCRSIASGTCCNWGMMSAKWSQDVTCHTIYIFPNYFCLLQERGRAFSSRGNLSTHACACERRPGAGRQHPLTSSM